MEDLKFALLIDSDNISADYIKIILDELSKYGTVTYKRIYGDWTRSNSNKWKDVLLANSINPVQQYSYTTGKNATDSAMIIDAMDILYSGHVGGFCLASSDSDFTRLAMRLRESGMYVIGMGASIFTGENDIAQILMKAGLGIAGLLIVVFSTVTTTFLDAYSAGISGESIVAKLKGKYAAVAVTVIGTVGAILYPMDDITDFLYLIGSVFAPMIAVQIADFFLLKKKKEERAFDWCNLVIWLVGFVLYRILMHVDFALGNTLPDMVLTILICLAVNAVKGKKNA